MADMTTTFGSGYAAAEAPRKPFASWLGGRLAALLGAMRREGRIRRDLAYLEQCDDRTLADIGLTRGQIEGAVRYGRYL